MAEQRAAIAEQHPEFDVVGDLGEVARTARHGRSPGPARGQREWLPRHLAETQRAVSRRRLRRYPYVRSVLDALAARFPLAVVTDGQSAWARG